MEEAEASEPIKVVCFIGEYRTSNFEVIREYFEFILENIQALPAGAQLTQEIQEDIKKITQEIDQELQGLQEEIDQCLKPGSQSKLTFTQADRELADQLVSKLQALKGEVAKISTSKA